MPKAKVWNDLNHDHKEMYKGDPITIPAKGFVIMETEDAYQFKGQFTPILKTADGGADPASYKMIRVEELPKESTEAKAAESPRCMTCNYIASSAKDLEEHTDSNHLDQLVDQELADKRRTARTKKVG